MRFWSYDTLLRETEEPYGKNAFEFPFHENGDRRNIYDRKVICSNIKCLLLRGTFLCIFKAERICFQRISDYEKIWQIEILKI